MATPGQASPGGGQGLIDQGYGVGQGGTVNIQGGTLAGTLTVNGAIGMGTAAKFALPYGTITPTLTVAGQAAFYFKGGTTFLSVLGTGGTYYSMYMAATPSPGTVLNLVGTALP